MDLYDILVGKSLGKESTWQPEKKTIDKSASKVDTRIRETGHQEAREMLA
jgi:hypothetical protein